jgi:hypothetical protein
MTLFGLAYYYPPAAAAAAAASAEPMAMATPWKKEKAPTSQKPKQKERAGVLQTPLPPQPSGSLVSIAQGRPAVALSVIGTCRHDLAEDARRQGRGAPETPVCQSTQACIIIKADAYARMHEFVLMFDDLHHLLRPTHASVDEVLVPLNMVVGLCTGRDLRGVTWHDAARFLRGEEHMAPPSADTLHRFDGMRFSWSVPMDERVCCEAVRGHRRRLHAHCEQARHRRCLMFVVLWRTHPVPKAHVGLTDAVLEAEGGGGRRRNDDAPRRWVIRKEVSITSPAFDWRDFLERFVAMVDKVRAVQSGEDESLGLKQ